MYIGIGESGEFVFSFFSGLGKFDIEATALPQLQDYRATAQPHALEAPNAAPPSLMTSQKNWQKRFDILNIQIWG